MNQNDTTFLQKIKDNAFYVALGLGLLAVLAVVAVYTTQTNGGADNELDLNQPSDYSSIRNDQYGSVSNGSTGSSTTQRNTVTQRSNTTQSNRSTAQNSRTTNNRSGVTSGNNDAIENIPDAKAQEEMQKRNIQVSDNSAAAGSTVEDNNASAAGAGTAVDQVSTPYGTDDGEQLPVTADVGELNFGSDKTLTWPVAGEVILPYSMDTTVYFKTLDQYQTNPGILIGTGSGSTVKSAYLGKVTRVTSDNVYGNLVTVYIGNDYSLVYGQLDTIYVKEGDYVKAGESIGTIGKPTDSFKDEGSHLFFQLLQGETPIDPIAFME